MAIYYPGTESAVHPSIQLEVNAIFFDGKPGISKMSIGHCSSYRPISLIVEDGILTVYLLFTNNTDGWNFQALNLLESLIIEKLFYLIRKMIISQIYFTGWVYFM